MESVELSGLKFLTIGAYAPVGDLCFVYQVAVVVFGLQTGRFANGTVNVDKRPALATHQMMMIVDSVFVAWRLNQPAECGE